MQTVEELIYYCKTSNPVGALLLTGEWGCGKTYLIEKELAQKLETAYEIIRISLFGIASVDELHKAVKVEWMDHCQKAKSMGIIQKWLQFFGKFKDAVPNSAVKGIAGGILSIDFLSFIKVESKIGGKEVIFVFDDLERSKLKTVDVLGVINDYCENQKCHVIVVADEKKIGESEEGLQYSEIKEKVIQRTVRLIPDYQMVVSKVVEEVGVGGYRDFLEANKEGLISLFAGKNDIVHVKAKRTRYQNNDVEEDIILRRPHNIRSLKTAISDYNRIYELLSKYNIAESDMWFFSFVSFTMAWKADLIKSDEEYGTIFYGKVLDALYPAFYDSRFLPDSIREWIADGLWNESAFVAYIEEHYRTEKDTPEALVQKRRIDFLEEKEVQEGLPKVIKNAYESKLSIDEYVVFIQNICLAREYGIAIPEVDWARVRQAIQKKIEEIIADNSEDYYKSTERIVISEKDGFTDEEWLTYSVISNIREKDIIVYEKNKRDFIEGIINDTESMLRACQSKRYRSFDVEMAKATVKGYIAASNPVKGRFPGCITGAWSNYKNSFDATEMTIAETKKGFMTLKEQLEELLKIYEDQPFKKRFTTAFISKIDELLNQNSGDIVQ